MVGRTILLSKPLKVALKDRQLCLTIYEDGEANMVQTPVEEVATVVIDHPQVVITTPAMVAMMQQNVNVVYCDDKHLPTGILKSTGNNHLINKRARMQLRASKPLQKSLWKYTVRCKIDNQGRLLSKYGRNREPLVRLGKKVRSGDPDNREGQAARYYWSHLFDDLQGFTRDRYGDYPNMMLNYGYSILRSAVARQLGAAGLINIVGIHHHNQYNAFCLADDIMEPYRPMVDELVFDSYLHGLGADGVIDLEVKKVLLSIENQKVKLLGKTTELGIALERTAYSLVDSYDKGEQRLTYPTLL